MTVVKFSGYEQLAKSDWKDVFSLAVVSLSSPSGEALSVPALETGKVLYFTSG